MGNKQPFNLDYVYTPVNTEDLRSVNISLKINSETMEFWVTTEQELAFEDLENIIKSIQEVQFNSMRINITEDCKVFLMLGGKQQEVIFAGQKVERAIPV